MRVYNKDITMIYFEKNYGPIPCIKMNLKDIENYSIVLK